MSWVSKTPIKHRSHPVYVECFVQHRALQPLLNIMWKTMWIQSNKQINKSVVRTVHFIYKLLLLLLIH